MEENVTLARKLGMTEHVSPLLRKARKLGLASAADLRALAIARGCSYYDEGRPAPESAASREQLSDAELAIALLHPGLSYHPQNIRLGAAMLGSPRNTADGIATLAKWERCEPVVEVIAQAGREFEPGDAYWTDLLARLPESPSLRPGVLPHRTRFVAMTGLTRRGRETVATWIRPSGHE